MLNVYKECYTRCIRCVRFIRSNIYIYIYNHIYDIYHLNIVYVINVLNVKK